MCCRSILWCRCKYCVHVCCRPLWVEYPQDLATFALEDEYLIGKTSNKIWGLQHSSSIHSDNCSLSLKDPSLSDLGLKVTPFTGSSTDTLLNKGSLMFKHAMSLSGTLFLSPYCAFLSCDSHDASVDCVVVMCNLSVVLCKWFTKWHFKPTLRTTCNTRLFNTTSNDRKCNKVTELRLHWHKQMVCQVSS